MSAADLVEQLYTRAESAHRAGTLARMALDLDGRRHEPFLGYNKRRSLCKLAAQARGEYRAYTTAAKLAMQLAGYDAEVAGLSADA